MTAIANSNITHIGPAPSSAREAAMAILPRNMEQMMQLAEILSKSTMVPKDFQGNPGNAYIAMQWGMSLGLDAIQAVQGIAVINGRPSMWGDTLLALVQGSGLLEYIHEDPTEDGCTCVVKRKGQPELTRTFTKQDAITAKLWNKKGYNGQDTPWITYPKRMMQMRARAFALRDAFADVLRGLSVAEEQQDAIHVEIIEDSSQPATSKTAGLLGKIKARKELEAPQQIEPAAELVTHSEPLKTKTQRARIIEQLGLLGYSRQNLDEHMATMATTWETLTQDKAAEVIAYFDEILASRAAEVAE